MRLDFLTSVAIAGVAFLVGGTLVRRVGALQRWNIPAPIVGGLLAAALLALPALFGVRVEVPDSGPPVQFLAGLLTTNMGLHVTTKVLRHGSRLFLLFVAAGVVLYAVQFVVVLPVALLAGQPVEYAMVIGPLAFVGVPFPPSQTEPIAGLFTTAVPDFATISRAARMVGVLIAAVLPGLLSVSLFKRAGEKPPRPSASDRQATIGLWRFSNEESALVILVLSVVALAFPVQRLLLDLFPMLTPSYVPVFVLCYLMGVGFRLIYDAMPLPAFPQKPLTVLLLGPTMALVLTYVAMTLPTHYLGDVTLPILIGALLAVAATAVVARLSFAVFSRFTHRYYSAVISWCCSR